MYWIRRRLRRPALGAMAFLAVSAGGCITINIYFPASAVEKAADRIIDQVWQSRAPERPPAFGGQAPASEAAR